MKFLLPLFACLSVVAASPVSPKHRFGNYIAVANRAGGTISLVNPLNYDVINYTLPDNGEPMYFLSYFRTRRGAPAELWVGDRANSRLLILKLLGKKLVPDGYLPTPDGLFHSMTTQSLHARHPLAVTSCDIANVTVVHDILARRQLCVMQRPKEVTEAGAKPHDVTTDEQYAYVTYLGAPGDAGYVASYNARTCELISVIKTAADPHVAVRPGSRLFIATQGGEVLSTTAPMLNPLTNDTSIITPHGIFISFDYRFVYIIAIGTAGKDAIKVFDQFTGKKIPCPTVNTTLPVPHNPTTSFNNEKLYITHSIRGLNLNSAWDIDRRTGCVIANSERIFATGAVPFGITVIPKQQTKNILSKIQ